MTKIGGGTPEFYLFWLLCAQQGVRFQPMVAETTGAWDRDAGKVLHHVARAAAAREGADPAALHGQLLQELAVSVRAHRARAVLRRRAMCSPSAASEADAAAAALLHAPLA